MCVCFAIFAPGYIANSQLIARSYDILFIPVQTDSVRGVGTGGLTEHKTMECSIPGVVSSYIIFQNKTH